MKIPSFDEVSSKITGIVKKTFGEKGKAKKGRSTERIPVLGMAQMVSNRNDVQWEGKERYIDPLNFTVTPEMVNNLRGINTKQKRVIDEQDITIGKQEEIIQQNSRSSRIMTIVSFAVGSIISWVGATIYGQSAPESWIQSLGSSLAKKVSDTTTGYELIQEGRANILVIKRQANEIQEKVKELEVKEEINQLLKSVNGRQEEIIGIKDSMITDLNTYWKTAEQEAIACKQKQTKNMKWKKQQNKEQKVNGIAKQPKKEQEVKPEKSPNYDSSIFTKVSSLITEVKWNFPDKDVVIDLQRQAGGKVLIWVEYKGKKSLGFYATTPRFENRLTKEGMTLWVQDSIEQLSRVEQIEAIAKTRSITSDDNSSINIAITKLYTGNIKVVLSDVFSGKTGQFILEKKNKTPDISGEIDKILAEFLL